MGIWEKRVATANRNAPSYYRLHCKVKMKCHDCHKEQSMVIWAHTPDGHSGCYCADCIELDWLDRAKFLGDVEEK